MSEDANRADPKPPSVDRLSLLWRRINDHKMVQWSVAYVALAYGIQHGVVLTREAFEWPQTVERISMLLLILGLPLVMTFAWYHGARASRNFSQAELSILAALLVMSSLLFYVFVQPREGNLAPPVIPGMPKIAAGGISVAVLPFVNLSDDRQQEFFSDGMTEEITAALAKVSGLNVVARTSAFQFKNENKDMRAIGQALGASHLIEGSVRKEGNEVRITAQLIKADDGTHLWTESYDRELKGVFAIQEEIATAIAAALKVPLGLQQGETLVSNRTSDPKSYDQYLRARALFRDRAIADAIKTLESVVAREPRFAPAWALLSNAYSLTSVYSPQLRSGSLEEAHVVAKSSLDKAEMAAREAIRLDSRSAETFGALGFVEAIRGQWAAAEDRNKQALGLDANNTELLVVYSVLLAATGRVKDALSVGERLRRLDPFVPQYNLVVADFMQAGGHSQASIPIIEAITGDAAGVFYRGIYLAQAYAAVGRYADAADALLAIKGENLVSQRSVQDAARLLRLAPTKVKDPQSLPKLQGELGFVYAYIGAPERAMEHPERLLELEAKDPLAFVVLWAPEFVQVRKTERFKAFVRKIGLVDYWRVRGWPDLCHPVGADDFVCD